MADDETFKIEAALYMAIANGNTRDVRDVVETYQLKDDLRYGGIALGPQRFTPLSAAITSGKIDIMVLFMKEYKVPLTTKDEEGFTARDYALNSEDKKIIETFEKYSKERGDETREIDSALYLAIKDGGAREVRDVVKKYNLEDALKRDGITFGDDNVTPLSLAIKSGKIGIMVLFMKGYEVPLITKDKMGFTAWNYAFNSKDTEIIQPFVRNSEERDKFIQLLKTLFLQAIRDGDKEKVIAYNKWYPMLKTRVRTASGKTAKKYAKDLDEKEIAALL